MTVTQGMIGTAGMGKSRRLPRTFVVAEDSRPTLHVLCRVHIVVPHRPRTEPLSLHATDNRAYIQVVGVSLPYRRSFGYLASHAMRVLRLGVGFPVPLPVFLASYADSA